MSRYKWVYYNDGTRLTQLRDVGILPDGTLHNPRGYPDDVVRAAVLAADERRHARASQAAKKAAETRRRRQDKKINAAALALAAGRQLGPRSNCYVCGRGLGDPQAIARGIGSECWQDVLRSIERERDARRVEGVSAA
jgi:Family of unknown function (DUF6011)